jgi:uncharacterized membrane protein
MIFELTLIFTLSFLLTGLFVLLARKITEEKCQK